MGWGGDEAFFSSTFSLGPSEHWAALRRASRGLPAPIWGSVGPGRGCWSGLQAFWATLSLGQDLCALGAGTGKDEEQEGLPQGRLIGLGIPGST